jgi:hypothetical protein
LVVPKLLEWIRLAEAPRLQERIYIINILNLRKQIHLFESIELAVKRSHTDFEHAIEDSNYQDHGVAIDTPLKRNDQLST